MAVASFVACLVTIFALVNLSTVVKSCCPICPTPSCLFGLCVTEQLPPQPTTATTTTTTTIRPILPPQMLSENTMCVGDDPPNGEKVVQTVQECADFCRPKGVPYMNVDMSVNYCACKIDCNNPVPNDMTELYSI